MVLHGHPRLTADLDLGIDLAPDAAAAAIDVLLELGLALRLPVDGLDFADPTIRSQWIEPTDAVVEVDLFAEPPLPFDELHRRSVVAAVGAESVRVAALADLIAMKREVGRPQDLADVESLEAIMEINDDD